ncbi:MAG TPA: hypothetical protein VE955_11585 [Candidatus Dormibacteraeota bacterium]|jgi:hypothetical protein|nr:hypothetical protein [Candidatus Dormibacteraeota bacterium]
MNFLKIEWTKKRGILALLATCAVVSSFILGGYVATGSWNPWGHRHYYQNLDVNFGYCVSGSQNFCNSVHNTMYNTGVAWIDQVAQGTTGTVSAGCFPSATCGMSFIALSASSVTLAASDASSGSSQGNCGAAGSEGGSEITTNGLGRAAATTNTLLSGATGSTSQLIKQFTATGTQAVDLACLVSFGTANSASSIQLAAASFTSVTLNNGDTIQITWTLTWTWS